MTLILNIETATKNCSVSIAKNGTTLALKEVNDGAYSHAEKLHEFIEQVVLEAGINMNDLNAVAVSKGPGSYTGLRIGVSAAKGLCFALDIPLISVNTLTSMAYKISISEGYIIPLLDARRMEVYCSVFNKNKETIEDVSAKIIDENSFEDYLNESKVYFIGDGVEKCESIIIHENAVFKENTYPSAKEMAEISYQKYKIGNMEDVAYFEPFYLKDFVVTKSKK